MAGFANTVGLRYLRSRRGFVSVVTGFSFLGIALGVAALLVVMAVMAGFRTELLDRILGATGHAQIAEPAMSEERAGDLQQNLLDLPQVTSATPYVAGQAMVAANGNAVGGIIRAMAEEDLMANELISENLIAGSIQGFTEGPPKVLLGKSLARNLGVYVGDDISLMSSQGVHTIMGFVPRMMRAEVAGVFEVGMHQYDSTLMFMSVQSAQNFFKLGNLMSAIEVTVRSPAAIESYRFMLDEEIKPEGRVTTWVDANSQFFQALQVERVAMFIILALIVVVAAFNIITGQMMTVNEKKRDIAILRTMGATRLDIMRLFFFSGFWIGIIGTFLGVAMGLLVIWQLHPIVGFIEQLMDVRLFSGEVYFLSSLPARIVWGEVGLIVSVSLALSLIASIYPAWRATRLDPVEALRNE